MRKNSTFQFNYLLYYDNMPLITFRSGFYFWMIMLLSGLVLFCFIPITWFKKLWDIYTPYSSEDLLRIRKPRNLVLRKLYDFSNSVMGSFAFRTIIYLVTIVILVTCSLVYLVSNGWCLNIIKIIPMKYSRLNATMTSLTEKSRKITMKLRSKNHT